MKRMLSEVLREAANKHLSVDLSNFHPYISDIRVCSCEAVASALGGGDYYFDAGWGVFRRTKTARFLRSLGCDINTSAGFNHIQSGEQRQGVRYMWLLLAACVAEDEGLTC